MAVYTDKIEFHTKGKDDIKDVTGLVAEIIGESKINSGNVTVFVVGSTASVTTIEYEPGLVQDVKTAFEKIFPSGFNWSHNETWGDANGHSHLKASTIGPSLTVPFIDGQMTLGTWQQIVIIDHDNRARERKVIVQISGE